MTKEEYLASKGAKGSQGGRKPRETGSQRRKPVEKSGELAGPKQDSKKYIFNGVNSLEGAFGDTAASFDLAVLDIGFVMDRIFIPTDMEPLFEQSITQLLDAFQTNRGYATALTAGDVTDYLEQAMLFYSLIIASWRAENAANLRTARGTNISTMYRNRLDMGTPTTVFGGGVMTVRADANAGVAISNAAWARDNLIYLQDTYLPNNILQFLFGLFSGVYSTHGVSDNGATSQLMFHPGTLGEADSVQVRARAAGVTLNTLVSAPDMVSFLKFMGWSNETAISSDLTRDIHGQTLIIYDDPEFLMTLINAKLLYSFDLGVAYGVPGLDVDIRDLYVDPTDEYCTPFNYRDVKQFDADTFFLTALLHRGMFPDPTAPVCEVSNQLKVLENDTVHISNAGYNIVSPQYIVIAAAGVGSSALVARITLQQHLWSLVIGIHNIGYPSLGIATDGAGAITGYTAIDVTSLCVEGPNVYYINEEDFNTYREIAWLRFLMGEDYRRWLQLASSRLLTSRLGE